MSLLARPEEPLPATAVDAAAVFACKRTAAQLGGFSCACMWRSRNLGLSNWGNASTLSLDERMLSPCWGCAAGERRLDLLEVPREGVATHNGPVGKWPKASTTTAKPAPAAPPLPPSAAPAKASTTTAKPERQAPPADAPRAPKPTPAGEPMRFPDLTSRQEAALLCIFEASPQGRFPTIIELAAAGGSRSPSTGRAARIRLEDAGLVEAVADTWIITGLGRRMARALKAKASSAPVPVEASGTEACEAPPAAPETLEAPALDEHSGELVIDVQPLAPEPPAAPLLPPAPIPPPEAAAPAPQEDPVCNSPLCAPQTPDDIEQELRARLGVPAFGYPPELPAEPERPELPAYAHRAIARREAHRLQLEAEREVARIFDNAGKLVAVQLRDGWPVEDAIAHLLASAELKVCDLVQDVVQNPGSLASPPEEALR